MDDEIRKDIFDREVIIAASRSKRPDAFRARSEKKHQCPFCPGNEKMTEKTILALPDEKNWQVRVFPNKFPVLDSPLQKWTTTGGMYKRCTPFGKHEIVVETRDHLKEYEDMDKGNLELALVALKMRYEELMKKDGINYVTIFKNKGADAGASLEHTHTQIIASSMFPEVISKEMDDGEAFFKKEKECGHCITIREELKEKKRIVAKNKHWLCITPFASVWPYQVRFLPREHYSELSEMGYDHLKSLARIYKEVFGMFAALFKDLPYNMMYHNFPRSELWHFRIELFPRLVKHAGFEFFGLNVNIKPPEQAARELRTALQ